VTDTVIWVKPVFNDTLTENLKKRKNYWNRRHFFTGISI